MKKAQKAVKKVQKIAKKAVKKFAKVAATVEKRGKDGGFSSSKRKK